MELPTVKLIMQLQSPTLMVMDGIGIAKDGYPCYTGGSQKPDGKEVPTDAYWSYHVWQQIQAKLDAKSSRWVIDEAFATGEEPYYGKSGFSITTEHATNGAGGVMGMNMETDYSDRPNATTSIYGGFNYASANELTRKHNKHSNTGSGWTDHPNIPGLGYGDNTSQYEYFSEGHGIKNDHIDLSYVGTGRTILEHDFLSSNIDFMDDELPTLIEWATYQPQQITMILVML